MTSLKNACMNTWILFLILVFLPHFLEAQKATITEETREFATYPFGDPNPIPTITGKKFKIYPYHVFDGYSLTSQMQKWKVVKLENDFIVVFILPEIGGKVWGAIEKSTGKEFIYNNDVVKFRNIAMRGPWTSGGIEYNLGLIGHSPSTANPVNYLTRENADGSVSCIVGNMDLPSRTEWRVEVRLPADKAYFETIPLWYNSTPLSQSYYCFMTGAAAVSDDLEFFYPGNQSLEHEGQQKTWPVQDGHLKSNYSANAYGSHTSIHIVGDYNDFMGGYFHKSEFGFGHWALYNDMPGRKLWLWALSREGEIWKDLLTDKHSQYMEFQAGRTFNQYAQSGFRSPIKEMTFNPGGTDQWKEIWFPVKKIGGLQAVSPSGILNTVHRNDTLTIGINALASCIARLVVTSNGEIVFSKELQFKPMDVFTTVMPLKADQPYEVSVAGMDLKKSSKPLNEIKRPFETLIPADTSSLSGIYLEGMEQKNSRNYQAAKETFAKCLLKDPLYTDAMAEMAEMLIRNNLPDSALYYTNRALQLNAYHPAANYYAGVAYMAQGDMVNALETLGWAARSMEFRSAAFSLMAGIELRLLNLPLAEQYAKQSLDFNRYNLKALEILAVKYRLDADVVSADNTLETILKIDPLNHFAAFEKYLLHSSSDNLTLFNRGIRNEFQYQVFLELAVDYSNLDRATDALAVLDKAPEQPLILTWKAWLKKDISLLADAAKLSPAFVFPYRTETVAVLKWAVSNNNDWKFKYYLALNFWAIGRENEARELFGNCGNQSDFAPFYASRASLYTGISKEKEYSDWSMAKQIDPSDWRNWNNLIEYDLKNQDCATALLLSTEAVARFKANYNLALLHARVQLANNDYRACIKTLENSVILPFEGSLQGKYVYEQAYMFWAMDLMEKGKYKDAVTKLEKSRLWPENLGVGSPYEPDNRLQDYLLAMCYDHLKRNNNATALRDTIVYFTWNHYADSRPTFNNILALWTLQQRKEVKPAEDLLLKLNDTEFNNTLNRRWVVASFTMDAANLTSIENELNSNNYLKILNRIKNMEK